MKFPMYKNETTDEKCHDDPFWAVTFGTDQEGDIICLNGLCRIPQNSSRLSRIYLFVIPLLFICFIIFPILGINSLIKIMSSEKKGGEAQVRLRLRLLGLLYYGMALEMLEPILLVQRPDRVVSLPLHYIILFNDRE